MAWSAGGLAVGGIICATEMSRRHMVDVRSGTDADVAAYLACVAVTVEHVAA